MNEVQVTFEESAAKRLAAELKESETNEKI